MSRTLFGYIARLYLGLTCGIWGALTVVVLVVDFGDHLNLFVDKSTADIAQLYWLKALLELHRLAPAAVLLAGGMTVSMLRKRSEWVAMQSVGASRWVMVLPIGACALGLAIGLVVFEEKVVTYAGPRVDQQMAHTFNRWGSYRFFYLPKQWFRVGQNVFQVRGETDDEGTLHDVSVFSMSPKFHLVSRVDADSMKFIEGSTWRLGNAVTRRFLEGGQSERQVDVEAVLAFEGTFAGTFRVRTGKPEFMEVHDILEQQDIRTKVGLPTQRFWLALHNRFSYPMTGVAASMLAVALALRPTRRGHLTLAIVEGLMVSVTLFSLLLIGKALVLGDHVPAFVAAWAPVAGLLAGSMGLWLFAEGVLPVGRRRS
jgi:lipopolysaccharide export system permease protein